MNDYKFIGSKNVTTNEIDIVRGKRQIRSVFIFSNGTNTLYKCHDVWGKDYIVLEKPSTPKPSKRVKRAG